MKQNFMNDCILIAHIRFEFYLGQNRYIWIISFMPEEIQMIKIVELCVEWWFMAVYLVPIQKASPPVCEPILHVQLLKIAPRWCNEHREWEFYVCNRRPFCSKTFNITVLMPRAVCYSILHISMTWHAIVINYRIRLT